MRAAFFSGTLQPRLPLPTGAVAPVRDRSVQTDQEFDQIGGYGKGARALQVSSGAVAGVRREFVEHSIGPIAELKRTR